MIITKPEIKVLDHGFVRLLDYMGDDLSVVRAARVSYNAEWRTGEDEGKDRKLIHYLARNHHTSPFESVQFTFEVKAPIFVFRQWHRHRTWSYNEVSARYSELPEEFYVPRIEDIGEQSKSNKQARVAGGVSDADFERRSKEVTFYAANCKLAFNYYHTLIEAGWPRELARMVLPVSTYSHMFATVDLKNLFDFLTLRLHDHAQFEIRKYAEAIFELINPIVPYCVEAWIENKKKWEKFLEWEKENDNRPA